MPNGGAAVAALARKTNFLFFLGFFFCFAWGSATNNQPRWAKKTKQPPTDAGGTSRYPQGEVSYGRYTSRWSVFYSYPFYPNCPINTIRPTG